jgi:hypothetical protein
MNYTTTLPGYKLGRELWLLDKTRAASLRRIQDLRMARQALIARVTECNEGGKILVVESGIDCDGVQYWGHGTLIDATIQAFDAHHDHVAKWADGTYRLQVCRPSDEIDSGSRDLALEAFEDGHPYSLYV